MADVSTSNWQNISLCLALIQRIRPDSVLDVGCGFGRWGFLCRESLDVWRGRTFKANWKVRIDAVEIFEPYITPAHRHLYDNICIGNVIDVLPGLGNYDMILAGDLLEHLEQSQGLTFLDMARRKARKAVLLIVPFGDFWPQGARDGNAGEEHRSAWRLKDFRKMKAECFQFWDNLDRPYGVVLFDRAGGTYCRDPWRRKIGRFVRRSVYRIKGY